jgi:hypothetical protein
MQSQISANDDRRPLLDRQEEAIALRAEKRILEHIRPFVTEALVEEHRADPTGRHSLELEMVLGYLRRSADPDMRQMILVAVDGVHDLRIAEHATRRPEAPMEVLEGAFDNAAEANHAIFLARLESLGLEIQKGAA